MLTTQLSLCDPRVEQFLTPRFDSTELVSYLADALRKSHGSYIVTRIIGEALRSFARGAPEITREVVCRFAVETDAAKVASLFPALQRNVPDVLCRMLSLALELRLDGSASPRAGVRTNDAHIEQYVSIFLCALAMLTLSDRAREVLQ